jgi:hypothetical protein
MVGRPQGRSWAKSPRSQSSEGAFEGFHAGMGLLPASLLLRRGDEISVPRKFLGLFVLGNKHAAWLRSDSPASRAMKITRSLPGFMAS